MSEVCTLPADLLAAVDDGAAEMMRGAIVAPLATSGAALFFCAGIARAWAPVYPPDRNAETVLSWPWAEHR
jgi:hypothetical protein